jgi:prevent-host-death family protein
MNLRSEGSCVTVLLCGARKVPEALLHFTGVVYSGSTLKGAKHEVYMLDITSDIQSLTTFRRSSGDFMKQLKKTKRPVVLTVNGKAAAVVQDAEAYQRLLDIAARADANEGIRQGLDDVAHGRTWPAREVFDEIRRKHGIPR